MRFAYLCVFTILHIHKPHGNLWLSFIDITTDLSEQVFLLQLFMSDHYSNWKAGKIKISTWNMQNRNWQILPKNTIFIWQICQLMNSLIIQKQEIHVRKNLWQAF